MPFLEPEQVEGVAFLRAHPRAILGDIMGFGKSAQFLIAAKELGAQRVVIGCPAIARLNWEREAGKWGLDLPILRIKGPQDHGKPHPTKPQLVLTSYDAIARSTKLRRSLNAGVWDILGLDEAHRLKTPDANRTKAIYGTRINGQKCLAGKALYRWLLTASIMPNGPAELWTHLAANWPELITDDLSNIVLDTEGFLNRYCLTQYSEFGAPKVIGYKDAEGLRQILQQIMLRRTFIKGLPPAVLREDPYLVEVDSEELRALEAHEEFEDLRVVLDSASARSQGLEGIEDEYLYLATLRRLTGLLKVGPVVERVEAEWTPGTKLTIFCLHREVIEKLQVALAVYQPAVVHGGVPDGKRNIEIDRYNEDPNCGVFIGQIQATKEVINLPATTNVWLMESSWSPEDNAQCIARARRRGSTHQVFAEAIAIAGSIDEVVAKVNLRKTLNVKILLEQ